jgi:hypothetical protein
LKIPGVEKLKVLHEIKAVVLAVPKEAVERIRGMKGLNTSR